MLTTSIRGNTIYKETNNAGAFMTANIFTKATNIKDRTAAVDTQIAKDIPRTRTININGEGKGEKFKYGGDSGLEEFKKKIATALGYRRRETFQESDWETFKESPQFIPFGIASTQHILSEFNAVFSSPLMPYYLLGGSDKETSVDIQIIPDKTIVATSELKIGVVSATVMNATGDKPKRVSTIIILVTISIRPDGSSTLRASLDLSILFDEINKLYDSLSGIFIKNPYDTLLGRNIKKRLTAYANMILTIQDIRYKLHVDMKESDRMEACQLFGKERQQRTEKAKKSYLELVKTIFGKRRTEVQELHDKLKAYLLFMKPTSSGGGLSGRPGRHRQKRKTYRKRRQTFSRRRK